MCKISHQLNVVDCFNNRLWHSRQDQTGPKEVRVGSDWHIHIAKGWHPCSCVGGPAAVIATAADREWSELAPIKRPYD